MWDIDRAKKESLLKWINSLNFGSELESLAQLRNGRHFKSFMLMISDNSVRNKLKMNNWKSTIRTFLEGYYEANLENEINFDAATAGDEDELAKICIYMLCASFTTMNSVELQRLTNLDNETQIGIKSIIECILKEVDTPIQQKLSASLYNAAEAVNAVSDKPAVADCKSPIGQMLQSPITVHKNLDFSVAYQFNVATTTGTKAILRDRAAIINKLKMEFQEERIARLYFEGEAHEFRQRAEENEKSLETLRKDFNQLKAKMETLDFDNQQYQLMNNNNDELLKTLEAKNANLKEELRAQDNFMKLLGESETENIELREKLKRLEDLYNKSVHGHALLCQLEMTNEDLKKELTSKMNEIILIKSRLTEAELDIQRMTELSRERQSCITPEAPDVGERLSTIIEMELNSCRQACKVLEDENKNQIAVNGHLKAKLSAVEIELAELNSKYEEEKIQLEANLLACQNECLKLSSDVCRLNDCCADFESKIDMLTKETDFKEARWAAMKAEADAYLIKVQSELTQQLNQLNEDKLTVEDENRKQITIINGLNANLNVLHADVLEANRRCEDECKSRVAIEKEMENLNKTCEVQLGQLKEALSEVSNYKNQLDLTKTKFQKKLQNLEESLREALTTAENYLLSKDQVESNLVTSRNECMELNNEVSRLNNLCVGLECKIETLTEETGIKEARWYALKVEADNYLNKVQSELKQLNEAKLAVEDVNKKQTAVINGLQANLNALQTDVLRANNRYDNECKNRETIEKELENLTKAFETQLGELAEAVKQGNSYKCQMDSDKAVYERKLLELEHRLLETLTTAENQHQAKIQIESNLFASQNECFELNSEVSRLNNCCTDLKSKIDALVKEAEIKEERCSMLKGEVDDLYEVQSELKHQLNKLNDAKLLLESENRQQATVNDSLNDNLKTIQAEVLEANRKCEDECKNRVAIEKEMENLNKTCEVQLGQLKEAVNEVGNYRNQLMVTKTEYEKKLQNLEESLQEALTTAENYLLSKDQVESNLVTSRNECMELNNEVSRLNNLCVGLECKIETLTEETGIKEARWTALKVEADDYLNKVQSELKQLNEAKLAVEDENRKQTVVIDGLNANLNELQADVLRANSRYDNECKNRETIEKELENLTKAFETQLGELTEAVKQGNSYKCQMDSDKAMYETNLQELEQRLLETLTTAENHHRAKIQMESNLSASQNECIQLNSEVSRLNNCCIDLKSQIDALVKEAEIKEERCSMLKAEVDDLYVVETNLKHQLNELNDTKLLFESENRQQATVNDSLNDKLKTIQAEMLEANRRCEDECKNRVAIEKAMENLNKTCEVQLGQLTETMNEVGNYKNQLEFTKTECEKKLQNLEESLQEALTTAENYLLSKDQVESNLVASQNECIKLNNEVSRLNNLCVGFEFKIETLTEETGIKEALKVEADDYLNKVQSELNQLNEAKLTVEDENRKQAAVNDSLSANLEKLKVELLEANCRYETECKNRFTLEKELENINKLCEMKRDELDEALSEINSYKSQTVSDKVLSKDELQRLENSLQEERAQVDLYKRQIETDKLLYNDELDKLREKCECLNNEVSSLKQECDIKEALNTESKLKYNFLMKKNISDLYKLQEEYEKKLKAAENCNSVSQELQEEVLKLKEQVIVSESKHLKAVNMLAKVNEELKEDCKRRRAAEESFMVQLHSRDDLIEQLREQLHHKTAVQQDRRETFLMPKSVSSTSLVSNPRSESDVKNYKVPAETFVIPVTKITSSTSDKYELRRERQSLQSLSRNPSTTTLAYDAVDDRLFNHSLSTINSSCFAPKLQASEWISCEDEEGEFHNVSYLQDLRKGNCHADNDTGRLDELQRRNTLCLPHLRTSYPLERLSTNVGFKEEDMKMGKINVNSLKQSKKHQKENNASETESRDIADRRKTRIIPPSYRKPGPPTPGKSGKTSELTQGKSQRTPSSVKNLFKRTSITPRSSAKYRVATPKRYNNENNPPTSYLQASPKAAVKKSLAFSIGFSPKVKKPIAVVKKDSKMTSTPVVKRGQN